jgi:hypothetical protein
VKKRSAPILASLMLLFTFVIGQVIVFAHSHRGDASHTQQYAQNAKDKTVDDNCLICAQHGNATLFWQQPQQIFFWAVTSTHEHAGLAVTYRSVQLLLAANRGPPVLNFFNVIKQLPDVTAVFPITKN